MSAPQILQCLCLLGTSSPDISRLVYSLIRHGGEDRYLSSLQGSELARVVDFLDKVRTLLPSLCLVTKQILQALDAIPSADEVYRQRLRKLQTICARHTILPSSYAVSGGLARVGDKPVAFGGFADVWEGIHNGRKVCVKALRFYLDDEPTLTKVRIRYRRGLFASTEEHLPAL